MNSLQVMAARFNQDAFWDPNLYPVPQTALEYPGNYGMTPLDANFAVYPPIASTNTPPFHLTAPIAFVYLTCMRVISHSIVPWMNAIPV
jgi:hypothetical protein